MWPFIDTKPFEVQQTALDRAEDKPGYAWFLEPGLGKTATALAEYYRLQPLDVTHMVVVAPKSLLHNWKNEFEQTVLHTDYHLECKIWPKDIWDTRLEKPRVDKPGLYIFNYEALLTEKGYYALEKLLENPTLLILDESQRIKNPAAQITKKLVKLAPKATFRRVLSGTPLTQSPLDLWGPLKFIAPKLSLNAYQFKLRFCKLGGFQNKQIVGIANEQELYGLLDKLSFRARKEDWLDLPEKSYENCYFEMSPKQQAAYTSMAKNLMVALEDTTLTVTHILTRINKLMQISRGFVYDEDSELHRFVEPEKNPAILAIVELLQDNPQKTVIMSKHKVFTQDLIEVLQSKLKWPVYYLTGGMSPAAIEEQKAHFNSVSEHSVMVCQIQSAATGHTLLGTGEFPCRQMLYAENTFSLELREQSENRIHRIGQHYDCVYRDFIGSKFDKRIIQILQQKRNFSESVMDFRRIFTPDLLNIE